jgi:tetratricopeptide (TPR) repeat protein
MKGALASGHHLIVAQAMFTEAVLECSIGANELAKAMLERTLDYAVEHGVVYFKMFAATYLSTLEGLDGDVERALRRIGDEIEFVRASGTYAYMPGFLAREGELLTLAGRVPEALTRFAEAFALMEQTAAHWDEATIRRRFATTLAVDGRETEAAGQLRRALAVARSQRARVYELEAACDMAPMLARKGRASEARDLLRSGLDYFAQEKMIPIMVRARDILLQLAPGGAAH